MKKTLSKPQTRTFSRKGQSQFRLDSKNNLKNLGFPTRTNLLRTLILSL